MKWLLSILWVIFSSFLYAIPLDLDSFTYHAPACMQHARTPFEARQQQFSRSMAEDGWFEARANVAKAYDPIARLVPNGIVDRIDAQATAMQQEWELKEFEERLEAMAEAAYAVEDAAREPGTTTASPSLNAEDKQAIKKITQAAQRVEKAVQEAESRSTDASTFLQGVWKEEVAKAEAELQATAGAKNVSHSLRDVAKATIEVLRELGQEMTRNPGKAVTEIAYTVTPFADAAKTAVYGVRDALRGEGTIATVALATATSIGSEALLGSVAGKVMKRGGRIIAAVEQRVMAKLDGKLFQEHHIISNKSKFTRDHKLLELAGFDLESSANKMFLPTRAGVEASTTVRSIHEGRHLESVSKSLAEEMRKAVDMGQRFGWNQPQYHAALMDIISAERQALKSGDRILNKYHRAFATDGGRVQPKLGGAQ